MAYVSQGFKDGDVLKAEHLNHIERGIVVLEAKLANFYAPITTTLSVEPSEAIVGQRVEGVKLTFTANKLAKTHYLTSSQNGILFARTDFAGQDTYVDDNAYRSTVTWTYEATEAEGNPYGMFATSTATATLTFYHYIYYGVDTIKKDYSQVDFGNLSREKASTRTFSFEVTPENQYIYVFIPEDLCDTYNDPTFIIDKGFAGGFDAKYKETITLSNGYATVEYRVYRSDQLINGKTRVDIS